MHELFCPLWVPFVGQGQFKIGSGAVRNGEVTGQGCLGCVGENLSDGGTLITL